jgi:hypothetical protein
MRCFYPPRSRQNLPLTCYPIFYRAYEATLQARDPAIKTSATDIQRELSELSTSDRVFINVHFQRLSNGICIHAVLRRIFLHPLNGPG